MSMITDALHLISGWKMIEPIHIQKGIRAMQMGVDKTLTAVATVDSDTEIGWSRFRFMNKNDRRSSVVLSPGTGNMPNQNPNDMRRNLSNQLISRRGEIKCVENQIRIFSTSFI